MATANEDVKPEEKSTVKNPEPSNSQKSSRDVEKEQEAQLRSKYPNVKGPGTSAFLQKRLSKGTKYFDSGDYNMAKAKVGPSPKLPMAPAGQKLMIPSPDMAPPPTGDTIPTPETVPQRKASLQTSKLVTAS
jgi:hypothetical protein